MMSKTLVLMRTNGSCTLLGYPGPEHSNEVQNVETVEEEESTEGQIMIHL